jgi:hypothetical protein
MAPRLRDPRGAASVEHAALVMLMALAATAVLAVLLAKPPDDNSLAAAIAFKQRCAVRHPDPCWRDPLTEAYGRDVAGAVRALAPPPALRANAEGIGLVGVDYRRCRQVSCATPGPGGDLHLTASNRRSTAFTHVRRGPGTIAIDYWVYRPTIGWERITRRLTTAEAEAHAGTPLLDSADPVLVPLETTLGRDDAQFRAGEAPPWRGAVESLWGR